MDLLILNSSVMYSENLNSSLARTLSYIDIESSNMTEYVFDLGPIRDSLSSVIPMTVIYVLIFISGLFGNVCTCAVISRNRHMRTATNYYLFSLAVSDLLLLVMGLPQELYQLWYKYPYVFGEAFCILRGFTSEMSTNASILTITCFTMERYLAICHPIRAHTMSKLSRAVKLICAVWIISGVCAVPMAIQFGVVFREFEGRNVPETAECTIKYPLENAFASSTFCFFIIPMAVISILYVMIGIELRNSESTSKVQTQKENMIDGQNGQFSLKKLHLTKLLSRQSTRSIRGSKTSSRKAVIKMLVAVVVAFFLCWAPFHCQRLMAIYVRKHTPTAVVVYTVLTHISGVTYYVSATINPILYNIISNKFREAFKATLANCCRKNIHYDKASNYTTSYTSVLRGSLEKNSCKNRRQDSNNFQHRDIENAFMTSQKNVVLSLGSESIKEGNSFHISNSETSSVT